MVFLDLMNNHSVTVYRMQKSFLQPEYFA